ncbi:MAG: murein biosynthesis integral membrane protein MurJ [Spirochaetaceae bacterium]|nr:MAG: murein biosynthesis integral membrane protein MurJ [Spirochaetaceae bacterium]
MSSDKATEPSIEKSALSTMVVMVSTMASRLLGFVRIAVIGAVFGGSGQADVLNLVFNIPNNLRKLLAEGALSSAFIPVLSSQIVNDPSGNGARRVVRNLIAFQFLILIPVLTLSIIFAGPITGFILDFPEPERRVLAAELFRYLISYVLLISIGAVVMGTLNSHNRFLIPAVTPIFFSISVVGSILLLHSRLGVFSMAVGVLLGGLGQLAFQYPSFRRLGYRLRPGFDFRNESFIRILKQWLPVVSAASIFAVNQQVSLYFASGLEDGSGSAMTNALVFWQLPFGIFSASITTVLFPRMSRQAAAQDAAGLKRTLEYGVRYLLTLLIPSAICLALFGRELISVALQRGAFEATHTLLASRVLRGYSFGLFSVGLFTFCQRFFYASNDFKTPVRVAFITFVIDVTLSLILKETALRVVGLSVANSVAFSFGALALICVARRRLGGLHLRDIARTLAKICLSSVPLVLFIRGYLFYTGNWWILGSSSLNFLRIAGLGLGSVVITLLMYYLLRVELVVNLIRKGKPL